MERAFYLLTYDIADPKRLAKVARALEAAELLKADGIDARVVNMATIKPIDTAFDPDADPAQSPRAKMQLLAVRKRKNNFQEVELSWSEPVARNEARRCLRCDYGKKTGTW